MSSHQELYKDPVNGKISGVCAGLANRFGLEVWLVRIAFISAALLSGTFLVLVVYIALTLMLEKQPEAYREQVKSEREHTLKSKPWRQGQSADQLLDVLERDFAQIDSKIQNIEAYVTSDTFKVNREFSKL